MKILMELPEDRLKYYSKISGCAFAPMDSSPEKNTVAVVVEKDSLDKYEAELIRAVGSAMPVVAIAGSKDTSATYAKTAIDNGIPGESVVVKDGDQIISVSGHAFGKARRGITLKMLCSICEYVLKNDFCPEILIWEERAEEKPQKQPLKYQKPDESKTGSSTVQRPKPEQPNQETGHINTEKLDSVLSLGENILAVFKTISESNSGKIASQLANRINAIHLEVSNSASSYKYYGIDLNEAIQSGRYAYSNGETVQISSRYSGGVNMVVEFDPKAPPTAMTVIYSRCLKNGKVIHTAADIKESTNAIKAWLDPGYQLDAIIPENGDIFRELKNQFGDSVCDVETLVQKVLR